jgi:phytoene desaturase
MKKNLKKKVIVIGAGPGGAAAAMLLAHQGYEVDVFEKNATVGGRNSGFQLKDYRFDVGPTFLMMKYLLDELFTLCGRKSSDYLSCKRLDPMYDLRFGDRSMLVTGNREKMKERIEALFPGESQGLDRFYEKESTRFKHMYPCLQRDYKGLQSYFSIGLLKAFPYVAAGYSLYEVLSDYFRSEELKLAFTFQSKYLGMSPWECPGGFAMIPYTEHAHGIYHVEGGLSEIPKAFMRVAKEEGARFHFSTPVREVLVEGHRAVGVELADGRKFKADEVIVNADFGHAVQHLFPKKKLKKWTPETLEKKRFSCSTFMLYLGLDRKYESQVHTIVFSRDYRKNLEEISNSMKPTAEPSVYVRNASVIDPTLAPAGHSALYVLAPVANNRSGIDWEKEKAPFRDQILDVLQERTPFRDLRRHIREERVISPLEWQRDFSVYQGATFNMSHSISQMMHMRPHNEFEEFSHCYLVGGGTHPGSGLPTIFESARISAGLICKKDGVPLPRALSLEEALKIGASEPIGAKEWLNA